VARSRCGAADTRRGGVDVVARGVGSARTASLPHHRYLA
jgi:hypothetical protein